MDSDGNSVSNQEFYYYIGGSSYSASSDSNGVAVLPLIVNKGNHVLQVFNPASEKVESANVKIIDWVTGNKNMNVYYTTSKTFNVRVYGPDAKPVKAGQKVTFTFDGKKVVVKTDKNGYAKLKLNKYAPGYHKVSAQYNGFIVGENAIVIKPLLSGKFNAGKYGLKVPYKLKLVNKNGKALKNKKIKVKVAGKKYTVKTNKKGIAKFKFKRPAKNGKFTLTATYGKIKFKDILVMY